MTEPLDNVACIGNASARVAVLGIGNDLSGDDAVGPVVARELSARLGRRADCLVLDAGTAPENFTGSLRRFRPDFVLLVDAAHLSDEAGSIAWLDWQETDGLSASTHTLPASVLAQYLVQDFACGLALLVVQPAHLEFGQPLSAAVRRAADRIVERLTQVLSSRRAA